MQQGDTAVLPPVRQTLNKMDSILAAQPTAAGPGLAIWEAANVQRHAAHIERPQAAGNSVPAILWLLLIFGSLITVGSLFVYADSSKPAWGHALVVIGPLFVASAALVVIAFFDHPYADTPGAVQPDAMELTLTSLTQGQLDGVPPHRVRAAPDARLPGTCLTPDTLAPCAATSPLCAVSSRPRRRRRSRQLRCSTSARSPGSRRLRAWSVLSSSRRWLLWPPRPPPCSKRFRPVGCRPDRAAAAPARPRGRFLMAPSKQRALWFAATGTAALLLLCGCGGAGSGAQRSATAVASGSASLASKLPAPVDAPLPPEVNSSCRRCSTAAGPSSSTQERSPASGRPPEPGSARWATPARTQAGPQRDDHTRIGSLTKTFTVMALLQLADQGRVSLDDPIGKYVPGVPNADTATLRTLANMTSGIPSYTADPKFGEEWSASPDRTFTPSNWSTT